MAKRKSKPRILIIAGPNGAGKTTFAMEFLTKEANCPDFLNADLIARGLSPFAPEKAAVRAGKIMLAMIGERLKSKSGFAFETTLSGLSYARHIQRWRRMGYEVTLFFYQLPNVSLAISRVAARVAQGGHSIPENVIRRRFSKGFSNFNLIYKSLVDHWILYDASGQLPVEIDSGDNHGHKKKID